MSRRNASILGTLPLGMLALGCGLTDGEKNACNVPGDCLDGFVCEHETCVHPSTVNPGAGPGVEPVDDVLTGDDTLLVRSRTTYVFEEMYLALPKTGRYHGNIFADSVLAPGGHVEVPNFLCGVYDVLLLDGIDRNCELLEQDLCPGNPLWTITDELMTNCRASPSVQNESGATVHQLYVATPNAGEWGANLLGAIGLEEGDLRILPSITCGTYDVLLVAELGSECVVQGVDLCPYDRPWKFTATTCGFF